MNSAEKIVQIRMDNEDDEDNSRDLARTNSTDENDGNPLFDAVSCGDLSRVKHLLQNNVDVNVKSAGAARTILQLALFKKKKSIIQILLENGANPNDKNKDGQTALGYFIWLMNQSHYQNEAICIEVVKMLLNNGADPIVEDTLALTAAKFTIDGTVMHYQDNSCKLVTQLFLEILTNDDISFDDLMPYYTAFMHSTEKATFMILNSLNDWRGRGSRKFGRALEEVRNQHFNVLVRQCEKEDDEENLDAINAKKCFTDPLLMAVSCGLTESVEYLMKMYRAIDQPIYEFVLHVPVRDGNEQMVKTILNQADLNSSYYDAINFDVIHSCKNWEVLTIILTHVAQRQVLDRPVRPANFAELLKNGTSAKFYYDGCINELESMKSCRVNESLSVFDVLMRRSNSRYDRGDKEYIEAIAAKCVDVDFPAYYESLKARFNEVKSRQTLVRMALKGLRRVSQSWWEPRYSGVFNQVAWYLSDQDLRNLRLA